jgi:hypothetical protein
MYISKLLLVAVGKGFSDPEQWLKKCFFLLLAYEEVTSNMIKDFFSSPLSCTFSVQTSGRKIHFQKAKRLVHDARIIIVFI